MNMSRTHLLSLTLILSAFTALASGERTTPSKPVEARVFLNGAQMTRSATATIPKGISTVIFTGLPQELDPKSLRIDGKGGFTILSVEHRMDHLQESPRKTELDELKQRLEKIQYELDLEKAQQQVYEQEEQLLLKNTAIGGQEQGVTASQLQAVNDYVRERLRAVKRGWLDQQRKITELNEQLGKLKSQMQVYQNEAPRPTSAVRVELDAPAEVNATFQMSYFTHNAGWTPAYDIRAKSVEQPVDIDMKAQVVNNTGEDWTGLKLSLSSGDPTLGGTMPTLHPWYLYPYRTGISLDRTSTQSKAPAPASNREMLREEDHDARTSVPYAVDQRATTFEFVITRPFNIPSDGRPHTVGIGTRTMPATYQHYVTPKLDKDAFLYARTTSWEDLDLLSGEANIFFEGTYVGQTFLDMQQPKDTLEIALGRDKGVVVERVKRKHTNDKSFIGGRRTLTFGWDITVRNNKSTAVEIEVRDQFPLSPQSEIEVKLEDKGDAEVDEQLGMLKWRLKLEPKASKKLGFNFTVRHPKDMPVSVGAFAQ